MNIDILIAGIALGSLYAIVALGYTMVYGVIELINFAHGDVFVLGAFVAMPVIQWVLPGQSVQGSWVQTAMPTIGKSILSIGLAVVVAALACAVVGVVIERLAYRPLRNAPRLAPLITAIGVSYILENLMFEWQGGGIIGFPTALAPASINLNILGQSVTIANRDVLVIVGAVVLMLSLDLFVNRTTVGKAMRAVAQDREAASMMGINADRIISLTFAIGSGLAGAGAVLYGLEEVNLGFNAGFALGLFAFTAAVLGGIGNIRGAAVGGLLIGILQEYVSQLGSGLGTGWYDTMIFAVLVLILVFRPSGIFGSVVAEKV